MNITVIGTGYVGLTTGTALSLIGHHINFVDIDIEKIEKLKNGCVPFYEPGLQQVFKENLVNMVFSNDYRQGLAGSEVIIIAVGTPQRADGSPDLTCIWNAVEAIIANQDILNPSVLLVNKSTVPVGVVEQIEWELHGRGIDIPVASNPEFLRQGCALMDNLYPSRLVFGGNQESYDILNKLYEPIIKQDFDPPAAIPRSANINPKVFSMDIKTAELTKYAANAFLAMKISFINEISNVADLTGCDVASVAQAIGEDERIGRQFLNAGIGYGGSCFPKDTKALRYIASINGYDFKLLSAVINVNNQQSRYFIDKLKTSLGDLEGKNIALLGLTFKPNTDDMREAPSISIINCLLDYGAIVRVHDPIGLENASKILPGEVEFNHDLDGALRNSDAVGILTEWDQYRSLTPEYLMSLMKGNLIVDGRNCLNPELFAGKMRYTGMGRRSY